MFAPEFLAALSAEELETMTARWEMFSQQVDDPLSRLAVDLSLRAAYESLGRDEDHRAVAQRVADNPARVAIFNRDTIGTIVERLRIVGAP